jgi:hypothetical protein
LAATLLSTHWPVRFAEKVCLFNTSRPVTTRQGDRKSLRCGAKKEGGS